MLKILIIASLLFAKIGFSFLRIEGESSYSKLKYQQIKEDKTKFKTRTILTSDFKYKDFFKIYLDSISEYNLSDERYKHNLPKAYLAFLLKDVYIGFGKQLIIWGSGRNSNPSNFVQEFQEYERIRKEEVFQEGVESLLVNLPIKSLNFEGVIPKKGLDFALKSSGFIFDADVGISMAKDKEKIYKGFSFERPISDLFILYTEGAFYETKDKYKYLVGIERDFLMGYKDRLNLGLEYSREKIQEKSIDVLSSSISLFKQENLQALNFLIYSLDGNFASYLGKFEYRFELWDLDIIGIELSPRVNLFKEDKKWGYVGLASLKLKYWF